MGKRDAPISSSAATGKPPKKRKHAHQEVRDQQAASLDAVKAGCSRVSESHEPARIQAHEHDVSPLLTASTSTELNKQDGEARAKPNLKNVLQSPVFVSLTPEEKAAFTVRRLSLRLWIAPSDLQSPLRGVHKQLDDLLLTYLPQAQGILMGWSDAQFQGAPALIHGESPFAMTEATFMAAAWRPRRGVHMKGRVTLMGPSHIGLLILNTFNASIPRKNIPQDWTFFDCGDASTQMSRATADDITEQASDDPALGYWRTGTGQKVENGSLVSFVTSDVRKGDNIISVEGSLLSVDMIQSGASGNPDSVNNRSARGSQARADSSAQLQPLEFNDVQNSVALIGHPSVDTETQSDRQTHELVRPRKATKRSKGSKAEREIKQGEASKVDGQQNGLQRDTKSYVRQEERENGDTPDSSRQSSSIYPAAQGSTADRPRRASAASALERSEVVEGQSAETQRRTVEVERSVSNVVKCAISSTTDRASTMAAHHADDSGDDADMFAAAVKDVAIQDSPHVPRPVSENRLRLNAGRDAPHKRGRKGKTTSSASAGMQ
ncbi:hypothetical protein PYCC9005_000292 [Savitreella phatthalungensis]